MPDKQRVFLEITSWIGSSFGATHYYGDLIGYLSDDWNDRKTIHLTHKLTQRQATKINKRYHTAIFQRGYLFEGFDTKDEIIELGKKTWRLEYPNAKYLVYGKSYYTNEDLVIIDKTDDFTELDVWEGTNK